MDKVMKSVVLLLAIVVSSLNNVMGQKLSNNETDSIVNVIGQKLIDQYPFTDIAIKYSEAVQKRLKQGRYYNLSTEIFSERISSDLQASHPDKHLKIIEKKESASNVPAPSYGESNNYGFSGVSYDQYSSTAYINIPGPLFPSQATFDMASHAMNMAAYAKNIIIDLRENPGGSGQVFRFLTSYFYEVGMEKFYLKGFYKDRSLDEQEWTYGYVPGKRNVDAKVYILTSQRTGSAAEGMAYALQKLGRAVIVGDTTAGAGIARNEVRLKNNLYLLLPVKMIVGPHSEIGWEGIGVIPDIASDDALHTAKERINQELAESKIKN